MARLTRKTAIVTGSASGIGRATVEAMAAEGARVVVADINEAGAAQVAEGIVAKGGDAVALAVDIGSEESIISLVAQAAESLGRIDILHNNAAAVGMEHLQRDLDVVTMDAAVWDHTMHVNLRGTMLMCKHVVPHMIEAGGGAIIITGAGSGITGYPIRAAYGASKAGLFALTQYVATSYGRKGIRCNCISPGLIMTDTARHHLGEEGLRMLLKPSITPYPGEPDDIANAAIFLASDESKYITAQMLQVDGGVYSHGPEVDMDQLA
jgi:NAD(P)-dependent dehydrogenase (short-subunit alcohol dehydrogenase family)